MKEKRKGKREGKWREMKRDKNKNNNKKKKRRRRESGKAEEVRLFSVTRVFPPLSSPLLPFFVSFLVGRPPEKEKEKTGLNMQL